MKLYACLQCGTTQATLKGRTATACCKCNAGVAFLKLVHEESAR